MDVLDGTARGPVRALVLGGGGIGGIAWEAGLVTGLRRHGIDLAGADLLVGTSAGSVVGTLLASGGDLDQLIADQVALASSARGTGGFAVDMSKVLKAFLVLFDPSVEPGEARRRIGRLALDAETMDEQRWTERIGGNFAAREWPDRRLLITAVDTETGDLVVWDRAAGIDLVAAVASSCAVPGAFPPVTIGGRRYMDGGIRSGTNADLAVGADVLVVFEPMANLMPRTVLASEIETSGARSVVAVAPDEATIGVFGADVLNPALWRPAFEAGIAQAGSHVSEIREAWGEPPE